VGPLLFIVLGVVALGGGVFVLRSFGSRYRIGRLLAATPAISVGEARDLAGGPERYVAIQGRIDAEDEFEDDAHRPLVLRRARIQLRRGSDWVTTNDHTTAVDFSIRDGLESIFVDHAALDTGLVVVPRESVGSAADAPAQVPAGTPADTPMRLLVEQVSSVEHAIVLGVPTAGPDGGSVRMTAGLGRPLILTTLERPEAMRVLAAGGPRRPLIAALAFAVGFVSLTIGIMWAFLGTFVTTAMAASPAPSAAGGDPRSSGQGPGLVGEPLVAVGLVIAIGLATTVATIGYVRLTGGRRS
jgi:hypothetical protein